MEVMSEWQRRAYDEARREWLDGGGVLARTCLAGIRRGPLSGTPCPQRAGQGTPHEGAGRCVAHGGAKRFGRAHGAWLMAHAYAAKRPGLTPWDALLETVQSLGGQVAFLRQKIGEVARVGGDDSLLRTDVEQGGAGRWVEMLRDREAELARVSKMAIDAGVAQVLVHRVQLQGELLYRAAQQGIADAVTRLSLPLDEDQQLELVASIARQVVRLEEDQERQAIEALKTLDGELG